MFGNKKLQELKQEVEFLKDRIWLLENPPEFKNGDKVYYKNGNDVFFNELIVVGKETCKKNFMGVFYKAWIYKLFNAKENQINRIYESDLILTTNVEQTNNTTSARD